MSLSSVCFLHYLLLYLFSSSNSTVDHRYDQMFNQFTLLIFSSLTYATPQLQYGFISVSFLFHVDATEQYVRVGTPQDQAMNLAVEMFILLLKACCTLLQAIDFEEKNTREGLSAPLRQFLPAIKVFADWLVCRVDLWQVSSIR